MKVVIRPVNFQHKQLAVGRWRKLSLVEQMANVGSEVERTMTWRRKGQDNLSKNALYRALELLSLTIDSHRGSRLKELTRVYELLVDSFVGTNNYASTDGLWHKYFYSFNLAARLRH